MIKKGGCARVPVFLALRRREKKDKSAYKKSPHAAELPAELNTELSLIHI